MPRQVQPLNEMQINKAKPTDKGFKMSDGGGLYLFVTPSGGKLWRMDYLFNGIRKTLSFGAYPHIPLKDARQYREEAKSLVAHGVDPSAVKKAQIEETKAETENIFENVAKEWYESFKHTWVLKHSETKWKRLTYLFRHIGTLNIDSIEAPELFKALQQVAAEHKLDVAHRTRNDAVQVFRYAVATGKAKRNIAIDLQGALPPVVSGHFAAPETPAELANVLKAIETYDGTFMVKCALQLAPMLLTRPGELRNAEWSEFDFDAAEWNIPAHRMKMKVAHLVPLPSQALAIIERLRAATGHSKYLFPSVRTPLRPMSDNTVNAALRRMGFTSDDVVGHGFRASARTIMDEVLNVRVDLIEHQLAHTVRDTNGRAYNRTQHLPERKKMLQQWADYLDTLKGDI